MSRQATWRNRILPKVKRHKLPIRYRAVGMIKDGVTQVPDARELDVNSATIKLWMDCKRFFYFLINLVRMVEWVDLRNQSPH